MAALDQKTRRVIEAQLQTLAFPYEASNVKKLKVHQGYRKRIGDYRALFLIDDNERGVLVTHVLRKNEDTYR